MWITLWRHDNMRLTEIDAEANIKKQWIQLENTTCGNTHERIKNTKRDSNAWTFPAEDEVVLYHIDLAWLIMSFAISPQLNQAKRTSVLPDTAFTGRSVCVADTTNEKMKQTSFMFKIQGKIFSKLNIISSRDMDL